MTRRCLVYFKHYPWENCEILKESFILKAKDAGLDVIRVAADLRDSESKELSSILSDLEGLSGHRFVIPSLDHFDENITDPWSLLKMLGIMFQHNVTFESLDESLSSDEHAHLFIERLVAGVEKAKATVKSLRIRNARVEAKEAGMLVGARKQRDDAKIKELRDKGLSIREIANELGTSTSPVVAALRPNA